MQKIAGSLSLAFLLSLCLQDLSLAQADREYEPISKVSPVYPETALDERLEGDVVVEYTITRQGTVANARAIESTDEVFEAAALESVSQFAYVPRVIEGEPVDVSGVRVRVLFRLPVEHEPH